MSLFNHGKNLRCFMLLLIVTSLVWMFPLGMFFLAAFAEARSMAFWVQSFGQALLPALVLLAVSAFIPYGSPQARLATEKG